MLVKHRSVSLKHRADFYYRGSWFQLIRPFTLTGTITPILVATGLVAKSGTVHIDAFIVYLIAALFVQAAVNMLNDYYDFGNGQDDEKWTEDSEFSGVVHPSYRAIPFALKLALSFRKNASQKEQLAGMKWGQSIILFWGFF